VLATGRRKALDAETCVEGRSHHACDLGVTHAGRQGPGVSTEVGAILQSFVDAEKGCRLVNCMTGVWAASIL
jgi:hypothetical protein